MRRGADVPGRARAGAGCRVAGAHRLLHAGQHHPPEPAARAGAVVCGPAARRSGRERRRAPRAARPRAGERGPHRPAPVAHRDAQRGRAPAREHRRRAHGRPAPSSPRRADRRPRPRPRDPDDAALPRHGRRGPHAACHHPPHGQHAPAGCGDHPGRRPPVLLRADGGRAGLLRLRAVRGGLRRDPRYAGAGVGGAAPAQPVVVGILRPALPEAGRRPGCPAAVRRRRATAVARGRRRP